MKKAILLQTLTVFMMGTMIIYCQAPSKKVENARYKLQAAEENLSEAQKELRQAQKDSVQEFRSKSDRKISENEKIISDFKAKIANAEKVTRARYEKLAVDLEQKNKEMKKKLDEFNEEGKVKWQSFKREFNRDMDRLEKSLEKLKFKNTK